MGRRLVPVGLVLLQAVGLVVGLVVGAVAAAAVSPLLRAPAARRVEDLRLSLQPVVALAHPPSVALLLLLPIRRLAAAQAEALLGLQLRRIPRSEAAAGLVLANKHPGSVVASVNSSRLPEDSASRRQLLASEHLEVAVVASACSALARQTTCRVEAGILDLEDERVVVADCQMR